MKLCQGIAVRVPGVIWEWRFGICRTLGKRAIRICPRYERASGSPEIGRLPRKAQTRSTFAKPDSTKSATGCQAEGRHSSASFQETKGPRTEFEAGHSWSLMS